MKVANVPMWSPYSVAEHAVGLVLALNRKLVLGQRLMHIGNYRMDHLVGSDLHGKTHHRSQYFRTTDGRII